MNHCRVTLKLWRLNEEPSRIVSRIWPHHLVTSRDRRRHCLVSPTPLQPLHAQLLMIKWPLSLRRALARLKAENDDLKMKTSLKSLNLTTNPISLYKPTWLLRIQGKENEIHPKRTSWTNFSPKFSTFKPKFDLSLLLKLLTMLPKIFNNNGKMT